MRKLFLITALATGLAFATPVAAQENVYTPGTYMTVQGIMVEDGQFENYMDYIAATYRRSQDFARQQGWITGYRIFSNSNPRAGEPHLYLLTEFAKMTTPQEDVARERQLNTYMAQTTRQATEQSGRRVTMRKLGSNILLQELILRPAK